MALLLCIGEGMLELRGAGGDKMPYGYAGDTLNAAIYAQRFNDDIQVEYLTGVGNDPYSQGFVDYCQQEELETQLILTSQTANLGIYAIDTDDNGERSFYYWRKDSAATQMVYLYEQYQKSNRVDTPEFVYFSGLSLGILDDENKAGLLNIVSEFKEAGSTVAFDPNYRPKLWRDKEHAIEWINRAYELSDIIFPGLDDHKFLFGHHDASDIVDYIKPFGFDELVLKCQSDGVITYDVEGRVYQIPFNPAPIQIDTTAAGDSFAGTYLASRMSGNDIHSAMVNADSVARLVVQHSGAIVDKYVFSQFIDILRK